MKRDQYWDCLKFILIFFVAYGHVLNATTLPDDFSRGIAKFIYLFHMPLFIFVSGRFSHIHDRKKYMRGIWRLLETFLLFMILTTFLKNGLAPIVAYTIHRADNIAINWNETFDYIIANPNYLWYLLTLIYYRIVVLYIPEKWIIKKKGVLAASIILSLAGGFIPVGYEFSVQRTLAFLPFFVLGYYSTEYDIKKRVSKLPSALAGGGGIILLFLICYMNRYISMDILTNALPYWNGHEEMLSSSIKMLGLRCLYIPSAITLGICVMRLVPTIDMLAKWGGKTMFIFIYHMFAITPLSYLLNGSGIIPQCAVALFVYSLIITFTFLVMSRSKLLNFMLNPVSNWKERKRFNCNENNESK